MPKKIDQTLRDSKSLLHYLMGQINNAIDRNPDDSNLHEKKQTLELFEELCTAATELNELHAKRATRIITFVEGMRSTILDEDKLPEDLLSVQTKEFELMFKPLTKDYEQIQKDYL